MSQNTPNLLEKAEKNLMFITYKPPVVMKKGKGMYLWDTDNRKYLDFVGGWAVTNLGHCHPAVTKAIKKQSAQLICASPGFHNQPQIDFAELLIQNTCMDKVFFTSTGAEANEGAIKLARKYGAVKKNGAFEIITTTNSFHGRTLATMSATGKEQWKNLFEPKVPGFIHVPYNDIQALKSKITPKTVAIMLEPVQGESGAFPAEENYVQEIRKICDEKNILLIFDEVQTGFARTGKLFAYEHYGVEPDIMTLGKGIGNGFPLSALLAKNAFCVFEKGDQGGTYTGQPLAMAAGLAVLKEMLKTDLCAHVLEMGQYLLHKLQEIQPETHISNFRGKGLLLGFDLPKENGEEVVARALKKGLLLNSPRPKSIRLIPPLIVTKKEIEQMIQIFKETILEFL